MKESDHNTHPGRPPLPDDDRASSVIVLRVQRTRKAAYVRAAIKKCKTLSGWAFAQLDRASGYKEDRE